jgi:cytoskeletal protein RodZ
MEKFTLKKLNDVKSKSSVRLKSEIGLQLWKTLMVVVVVVVVVVVMWT